MSKSILEELRSIFANCASYFSRDNLTFPPHFPSPCRFPTSSIKSIIRIFGRNLVQTSRLKTANFIKYLDGQCVLLWHEENGGGWKWKSAKATSCKLPFEYKYMYVCVCVLFRIYYACQRYKVGFVRTCNEFTNHHL